MTEPLFHGWRVLLHPLFRAQYQDLAEQTRKLKARDPENYKTRQPPKFLAAVHRLAFDIIPANPADPAFRQGHTLGEHRRHWCRAKFFQQYRLFFRFHAGHKTIVLAWVNDEDSLHAYGLRTDAYAVFRHMLESGHPPENWDRLVKECQPPDQKL